MRQTILPPHCMPHKTVTTLQLISTLPAPSQPRLNEPVNSNECVVESTTGSSTGGEVRMVELGHLNKQIDRLKMEVSREKGRTKSYKEVIRELLIEKARTDRLKAREKSAENQLKLGLFKPIRSGEHFKEQWKNGNRFDELDRKLEAINKQKAELQNAQQNLRKSKPTKSSKKASTSDASDAPSPLGRQNSTPTMDDVFLRPELPRQLKDMSSQDVYEQEEIMRLRRDHLKKEEADLQNEKERLERERNLHIREMKRIQCEDQSRFKNFECLHNNRYLLISLLGKGGFSEVWRAYDLDENRYVACKIHHVRNEWKEDKKANYVKHAMREKDIHRSLNHPRIVRLFDVFSIDSDSFCTVLEYCDGNDLDFYLKQHKQMSEREAKSIIMQVVSALKYLSERPSPIIHYDLKPANILLQSGAAVGEIKITDFGLSKQIDNADDESIELTSQGAGTYWYLPPETFQYGGYGGSAPKISSKVDVWSVGVILYQCLYGKRPFGNDRTQQQILEERIILSANQVDFPNTAKVSSQAQSFIRACLQYDKDERADVTQLFQHEFLKKKTSTATPT
ncbi:BMA-TLK-1, isoform e [Aphelenchoides bicaudatus]|nr:BMA-TLK-1, isoform e [Aphelenchoides bicaudatus]